LIFKNSKHILSFWLLKGYTVNKDKTSVKTETPFFDTLRDFVYNHDEWAKIKVQQIVQTAISVAEVLDKKDLSIVKDALDKYKLRQYSEVISLSNNGVYIYTAQKDKVATELCLALRYLADGELLRSTVAALSASALQYTGRNDTTLEFKADFHDNMLTSVAQYFQDVPSLVNAVENLKESEKEEWKGAETTAQAYQFGGIPNDVALLTPPRHVDTKKLKLIA
jgi:hypothetical protein